VLAIEASYPGAFVSFAGFDLGCGLFWELGLAVGHWDAMVAFLAVGSDLDCV
jgi:hypothetical protein